MKQAGFNFIRGSHYPHHPYFTTACDQLGLIFLPENVVWGIGGFKADGYWDSSAYPIHEKDQAPYEKSAAKSLEDLIRINRNSPSVMAWSMSNEPFFTADSVVKEMKEMLVRLVKYSHILDPNRPVVIGGAQRKYVDVLGDIAGYNGDGAELYREPAFPSMVCEYGSCIADRPAEYIPSWGSVHNGEKPIWRSGHAIWCGFDHGSIAGKMGKMGIVDFARIPKRSWYWYRNYFRNIPAPEWAKEGVAEKLKLYADKTIIKGTCATDDAHINVMVIGTNGKHISNSPDVTLTIVSGPGEFPTGRSITFKNSTENDIQILNGHAAIAFRSYEGGETIIKATSLGLKEAILKIMTVGEPLFVKGVTHVVKERKYVNYAALENLQEESLINVSNERPTKSNAVSKSKPFYANDGNLTTVWEPMTDANTLWWQLDMENFYSISSISINLVENKGLKFKIEVSEDGLSWQESSVDEKIDLANNKVVFKIKSNNYGRFLKISFSKGNRVPQIGIREIEVIGRVE